MLYRLVIRDPEATPMPHWPRATFLRGRTEVVFKPGMNIVYGLNATGKSTLIDSLATLLHCKEENWPKVTKTSVSRFLRSDGVLADGLLLEHDGAPARYLGVSESMAFTPRGKNAKVTLDVEPELRTRPTSSMSSGQATLTRLSRFLSKEPPRSRYMLPSVLLEGDWVQVTDVALESVRHAAKRMGAARQQVVLLDEVDRSLDFGRQAKVWRVLTELVAGGKHQVIVASHSPIAVSIPEAHYIETTPGYLETSRRVLRERLGVVK